MHRQPTAKPKDRYGGREYVLFKHVCPHYDDVQSTLANRLKSEFQGGSKLSVLELGCGDGYTTKVMLNNDPRLVITAIDVSAERLEQAANNLHHEIEDGRLKLVLSDALVALSKIKTGSFDAFASAFALHNFEKNERHKVLKQVFRILKVKGIFVNADKYAHDEEQKHLSELSWQIKQFDLLPGLDPKKLLVGDGITVTKMELLEEKKRWLQHYRDDNQPNIVMREGESIKEMKKIGFRNIKIVYRHHMEAVLLAIKE